MRYSDSGEALQNSQTLECGLKLSLVKSFFMHCMYRSNIGSSNVLYANVVIVHKICGVDLNSVNSECVRPAKSERNQYQTGSVYVQDW